MPVNMDNAVEDILQEINGRIFSNVNAVNIFLRDLALRYYYIDDEGMDDILDQVYAVMFIAAARNRNIEVMEHLININPTVIIIIDESGQTALHHIINSTWNAIEILENINWLLGLIPNDIALSFINHQDNTGATALYLLAYRAFFVDTDRYDGAIDLLIENGAELDIRVRNPLFNNEQVTIRRLLGIDDEVGDEEEENKEESSNDKKKKYVDDIEIYKYKGGGPDDDSDEDPEGERVSSGFGYICANKQRNICSKNKKNTNKDSSNNKEGAQDSLAIEAEEQSDSLVLDYIISAISLVNIYELVQNYCNDYSAQASFVGNSVYFDVSLINLY